jgi:hypothetical protein
MYKIDQSGFKSMKTAREAWLSCLQIFRGMRANRRATGRLARAAAAAWGRISRAGRQGICRASQEILARGRECSEPRRELSHNGGRFKTGAEIAGVAAFGPGV